MRELIALHLPWMLSAFSVVMFVLIGNKWRGVWVLGVCLQFPWLLWIWASASWGLLPLTLFLLVIYTRNHFKWRDPAAGTSWKPISTAPKEQEILVAKYMRGEWRMCQSGHYFDRGNIMLGHNPHWYWSSDWDNGGITDDEGPSHWMERPEMPKSGS